MKEFLLTALGALIFVVIFQISKASEYVSVLKGEEKRANKTIRSMVFSCWASWYLV